MCSPTTAAVDVAAEQRLLTKASGWELKAFRNCRASRRSGKRRKGGKKQRGKSALPRQTQAAVAVWKYSGDLHHPSSSPSSDTKYLSLIINCLVLFLYPLWEFILESISILFLSNTRNNRDLTHIKAASIVLLSFTKGGQKLRSPPLSSQSEPTKDN